MKLHGIILITIMLVTGCAAFNFNGPLNPDTIINELRSVETVLKLKKSFRHDGNELPKGIYRPKYETTGGFIIYVAPRQINVENFLGVKDLCTGGIAVKINDPENKYFISVQNCLGEPNLRIDIPKELTFEITRA